MLKKSDEQFKWWHRLSKHGSLNVMLKMQEQHSVCGADQSLHSKVKSSVRFITVSNIFKSCCSKVASRTNKLNTSAAAASINDVRLLQLQ